MPVVVLDTNVIISGAISARGLPNRMLRAWQQEVFDLVTSNELIDEVRDVLNRPAVQSRLRLDQPSVERILAGLESAVAPSLSLELLPLHCRDPKDDHLLALALGASADFIVTGDADLLALQGDPALGDLRILTPSSFWVSLQQSGQISDGQPP